MSIEAVGSVVWQTSEYKETVIASNYTKGKQIIACKDSTSTTLYRIEYYKPLRGLKLLTHEVRYSREEAYDFYRSI